MQEAWLRWQSHEGVVESPKAHLVELLAADAVMVTDGGVEGRSQSGLRNLTQPLVGAERIAAFVAVATTRSAGTLSIEEHELNGQPALIFWEETRPFAALLLEVSEGKITRVFFHADVARLRFLGRRSPQRETASMD